MVHVDGGLIDLTGGADAAAVATAFFDGVDRADWLSVAATLCDRVALSRSAAIDESESVPGTVFIERLRAGHPSLTIQRVVHDVRSDGPIGHYAADVSTFRTDGHRYHSARETVAVVLHMHPGTWCIGEIRRTLMSQHGDAELVEASSG